MLQIAGVSNPNNLNMAWCQLEGAFFLFVLYLMIQESLMIALLNIKTWAVLAVCVCLYMKALENMIKGRKGISGILLKTTSSLILVQPTYLHKLVSQALGDWCGAHFITSDSSKVEWTTFLSGSHILVVLLFSFAFAAGIFEV